MPARHGSTRILVETRSWPVSRRKLDARQKAVNKYLRAFETDQRSQATYARRLRQLEQEITALEGRKAILEPELAAAPGMLDAHGATDHQPGAVAGTDGPAR